MKTAAGGKLNVILSMVIFGTIGVFVRNLPFSSSMIALARGLVGTSFLWAVTLLRKKSLSLSAIRANLIWLVLSGSFLGFNWILLFEAYRFTTVATATLCYYMAPILIILVSPILLKEALSFKKVCCVVGALAGTFCISGVLESGLPSPAELKGILLGLSAAILYACIVLMNKQIRHVSAYDKTIVQLGISAIVLLPYCFLTGAFAVAAFSVRDVVLLFVVGILHTGFAYLLYFGAIEHVRGQTAAIISYIDPVIAVLASVLILREPMHITECIGAVLILGAALLSELSPGKRLKRKVSDDL